MLYESGNKKKTCVSDQLQNENINDASFHQRYGA